ncbi:hypothetical protein DACRYDRAFT_117227 [Dacryopinax primogenitus]|uniref:Uncharacterized protein n=1 Tax=Dacryopinax primogenitus (strain DJM 731) TaxID=1858805 RepID=M5FYC4_DACPD|nr:uncharacterized protein DACRYDRAFT_117227 [Dacryopinax primogenitus]EJU00835.1 hypothetical protein DACRYDRAFT_117227 [Dacryopinax primogenitus]
MAIEEFLGTRAQKILFSCVVVQSTVVVILAALSFAFVEADIANNTLTPYKTLPCYFSVFALAGIFTIYITLDALWNRNVITLMGMVLFTGGLIVFSGIQIREVRIALEYSDCQSQHVATCMDLFNIVERFLIVVPIIIFLALIVYCWCTRRLFGEFGWAVFHIIGADPKIKYMYRFHEVLVCLLKFDYFAVLALTMQLTILDLSGDTVQHILTIAAIPVSLVLLFGCGLAAKREIRSVMIISLFLMGAAMAYILYKMTRFWVGPQAGIYTTTRGTLTFYSIACSLMLGATFGIGVRCLLFFGCGLKQAHQTAPERVARAKLARKVSDYDPEKEGAAGGMEGGAALERRLSID